MRWGIVSCNETLPRIPMTTDFDSFLTSSFIDTLSQSMGKMRERSDSHHHEHSHRTTILSGMEGPRKLCRAHPVVRSRTSTRKCMCVYSHLSVTLCTLIFRNSRSHKSFSAGLGCCQGHAQPVTLSPLSRSLSLSTTTHSPSLLPWPSLTLTSMVVSLLSFIFLVYCWLTL